MAVSSPIKPREDTDDTILKNDERTLISVFRATKDVQDWSLLALLIGVNERDYDSIMKENHDVAGQQRAIIKKWLQTGKASWATLVSGLVGLAGIGNQIAKDHPNQQSSRKGEIQKSTAGVDVTPAELDVDSILVPPRLNDVFMLTRSQSAKWDDIGRSLNVVLYLRKILRSSNSPAEEKLEEVLDKWIGSRSAPVTWSYFIKALESIEMNNVAKEVKDFLKTPKAVKFYGKS